MEKDSPHCGERIKDLMCKTVTSYGGSKCYQEVPIGYRNWTYEMAQVLHNMLDGFDEIMHIADLDF